MIENVTQNKSGAKTNVGASVKILQNVMYAKRVIFGILDHVLVKMAHM